MFYPVNDGMSTRKMSYTTLTTTCIGSKTETPMIHSYTARLIAFAAILLMLAFNIRAQQVGWRGIIPLRSTEADVKRLLGKPVARSEWSSYYVVDDEIVVIQYQTRDCGKFGIGWQVPRDVVTVIGVIPKRTIKKEQAGVTHKFKVETTEGDFIYYRAEDDSVVVETLKGGVTNISYYPGKNGDDKKCKATERLNNLDIWPTVGEFGSLSKRQMSEQIVHFLRRLKAGLTRGVIDVGGRTKAEVATEMQRLAKLVRVLSTKEGFDRQRVLIVDGGYVSERRVRFHQYPIASELLNRINIFRVAFPE